MSDTRNRARRLYAYISESWLFLQPFIRDQIGESVSRDDIDPILVELGNIAREKTAARA